MVENINQTYKEVFLSYLPNIYKNKLIGFVEEKKLLKKEVDRRDKVRSENWQFKKDTLSDKYEIKIMSFEGRNNIIFEQLFEILSTNPYIIAQILLQHTELTENNKLLKIIFSYFGGFSPEFPQLTAMSLVRDTTQEYMRFFFEEYIPATHNCYKHSWEHWFQFMRQSRFGYPKASMFLNVLRWAFDVEEVRMFYTDTVQTMVETFLKANQVIGKKGHKAERWKEEACSSLRYLIDVYILDAFSNSISWNELASYLETNKYISEVLDEVIAMAKSYIRKCKMDGRNLALFMIHFIMNVIIIPQTARICRVVLFENDLIHKYMFLTEDWLDPPYDVFHLESNKNTLALYVGMLDVFNSIFPSFLIQHFNPSLTEDIDEILKSFISSYDVAKARATLIDDKWMNCSPYLDRVHLIPVEDFNFFYKSILNTRRWLNSYIKKSTFEDTFTLLEVLIEELKFNCDSINFMLGELLRQSLSGSFQVLIIISTNMTSLYNLKNIDTFKSELEGLIYLKHHFIEKYNDSLNKLCSQIVDTLETADEKHQSNMPLFLNQNRKPYELLLSLVDIDDKFEEVFNMILENLAGYILWRKLSKEKFQIAYMGLVGKIESNNIIIKEQLPKLKKYNLVIRCILSDKEYLEGLRLRKEMEIGYTEEYLRSFFIIN